MDNGLIPRRYAKAILDFAVEHNADQALYGLAQNIEQAFRELPALSQTLANPFVAAADKETLIRTASKASENDRKLLDRVLELLAENNRLSLTRQIFIEYCRLYRQRNNIHQVKVTSAAKLDQESEKRLLQTIAKHLPEGAKLEYSSSVDPELIGGFTVAIDNDRLDASVVAQLNDLRRHLINH